MKSLQWFTLIVLAAALAFSGCEEKKEEKKDDKTEEKAGGGEGEGEAEAGGDEAPTQSREEIVAAAKSGTLKVGDSCAGLSASDGLFSCTDKQAILFCSSVSEYKWQEFGKPCGEGKVCVLSDDAKKTTCEKAPAEGDAAPAEGDAAPAEGDAAPAEGDAAPAEGDAAPAEGDGAAPATP